MSDLTDPGGRLADVEQILDLMHRARAFAQGRRYPLPLPGSGARSLLARGPKGEMELLIRATAEESPRMGVRNVVHEPGLLAEGKEPFPVLRVWVEWEPARIRLLAHLAYEVARLLGTGATVAAVLVEVTPLLRMIMAPPVMSVELQKGLLGELLFLERLLDVCSSEGLHPDRALEVWKGHHPTKRDFAGNGVGVEAKTTSVLRPSHEVGMEQLEVLSEEQLYLWSVSAVRDTSGNLHLVDLIERIEARFPEPARSAFSTRLASYGGQDADPLDPDTRKALRLEPGFRVPGRFDSRLWRIDEAVERLTRSRLVGATLPRHVSDVGYTLHLGDVVPDEWHPVSMSNEDAVLRTILGL